IGHRSAAAAAAKTSRAHNGGCGSRRARVVVDRRAVAIIIAERPLNSVNISRRNREPVLYLQLINDCLQIVVEEFLTRIRSQICAEDFARRGSRSETVRPLPREQPGNKF